jgi:hypothetical protein
MSDSKAACRTIDQTDGFIAWLLERAVNLQAPEKYPQPVFFNPF